MCLRIFSTLAFAALLAGCGANVSPEPDGAEVECAIGPGAEFSRVCTLEALSDGTFIIHHPDGGFRRFGPDDNGKLDTADGADTLISDEIDEASGTREFALEVDRYRVPADLLAPPADE